MIEFDVDMGYLLECDELDKVVLNDENGEHEPMEFVPIAVTVGDKSKDNPRNYNSDGTPKIPNMNIGADPDWVDWVASLEHKEPLDLTEVVKQLMFEVICFGGEMGPNDCGGEYCPDEGMVYTNDFINGWVNKIAATVGRSCASCPEMDNPDSYISHIHRALEWHDEHVPIPTNPRGTCVVLQGKKTPEEVLFVRDDGGVTHYLPEETCHYDPDDAGFTWWDENDVEHHEEYSASDECWSASCDKCGYTMMVGDEGWFDGWDEITEWTEEDGSEHKGYVLKARFKHCPNCGRRVVSDRCAQ